MTRKLLLLAASVVTAAVVSSATAQTLTLDDIGVGGSVSVTGGGAPPLQSVELYRNGTSLGSVPATAFGQFSFPGVTAALNDQFQVTASQIWHFNSNGNSENWSGLAGDSSVVSGGTWRNTNSVGSDMSLSIYGNGLIQSRARVLEMRLRYLGSEPRTGSLILQTAGPNGVADGGGDDGNSVILNTFTFQSATTFQTLYFDLGINHAGAVTCWLDGTPPISITFYVPGTAIGDAIEVDYIRLNEFFDWNFSHVGDLGEWQPNATTTLFATNAGTLRLQSTAAGSVGMARPFRNIGSSHFTQLEARYRTVASVQPNLLNWNYISNPSSYGNGGFQTGIAADGNYEIVTLDLSGSPLYGNAWTLGGGATLNVFNLDAFAPFFATAAGEFAEVDYIRLKPASPSGPSPIVLATGSPTPPAFYVSSSTGSDLNPGRSTAQPWRTFTNLYNLTLGAGATVHLKRGDTWTNQQLRLTGKGVAGNPITLTAYGEGPSPVITGINLTNAACIVWDNPSYVRIDSMHCRDAKVGLYLRFAGGNTDGTGAMFNNTDVAVIACHFQNMHEPWSDGSGNITVQPPYELSWGAGIWLGGSIPAPPGGPWPSESTPILNNFSVTHCGFEDCSTGVGMNFYFPSVYRSRFTNFRFEDSWVTGCENGAMALFYVDGGQVKRVDTWRGGNGFYATGTTAGFIQHCRNVVIADCEFAGNKRNGTGNDGCGFDFEGNTENVSFLNNVVHNNDGSGMLLINSVAGNSGFAINHNTFWNDCRNPKDSGQNNELRASTGNSGSYSNNGIYLGAATSVGAPVVYNNAGRWIGYSGGLFNRTNTPYATVSSRPTAWQFTSSVEGWGNANQWSGFAASGGALVGTSSGIDPYVESPATWVNTRERRWVRVRLSQTAGSWAQIFFQLETDPTFTPGKSVFFPIVADGVLRDYLVDLGQSAQYQGVVTRWRLDPTDAAGSDIVVDAFEAMANPTLASITPVSSRELEVRFNFAMLPSGGVFNPVNYTLGGLGQGTLTGQPDTVSLIATTNGPVYRLQWNTGNMNGGPASLTAVNALDARGRPLWGGSVAVFTSVNGIVPTQSPLITAGGYDAGNLTLAGTNGTPGGLYYVLASTNVALPLLNWERVHTNVFAPNGSFSATLPVDASQPQRFYQLQLP